MLKLAEVIARLAGWISRRTGRGGGTTLPGVVLLKLRPKAIAELSSSLTDGSIVVSATNGKTTTTRLVAAWARATDQTIVTNAAGSNLERGVAAALLDVNDGATLGVFEVDEAALDLVSDQLAPRVIALMNLFRDQLDRYGELETLVDRWAELIERECRRTPAPILVLNADDPNIAELGLSAPAAATAHGPRIVWFGIDDTSAAQRKLSHAVDATVCRRCGSPLAHDAVLLGHLGHWRCTSCDARRPRADVAVTRIALNGVDGNECTIRISSDDQGRDETILHVRSSLPGMHNVYNLAAAAAAAVAAAQASDSPLNAAQLQQSLSSTTAAFGRGEQVAVAGTPVNLMLAKNPTGVNQNLRTILPTGTDEQLHVLVLLNDRTADGQDVSWIWDVDWEELDGRIASLTLGGDRAWDLALRFRYGGFDIDESQVHDRAGDAFDAARAAAGTERLHVLPTYTAMLDLRALLSERGYTGAYWEEAT